MTVNPISDQDLIMLYLGGSERAFEELLLRHKQKIYGSIYLFVKDSNLAEYIFQEVFIKIIDTLRKGTYNHEGKFLQWALRISYNMCVDYFRRNKRKPKTTTTDSFDIFDVLPLSDLNAEQAMVRDQTHDKIKDLLDLLPEEQREVVILRHYADMSFKEISKLTRVSINTALGRMRYALINIRKIIEEKELVLV
ncbi:MAG: sigma-70 family RNA polymerase sigma factor [Bacteroidota bacterium]